jgi:hypothetical protein
MIGELRGDTYKRYKAARRRPWQPLTRRQLALLATLSALLLVTTALSIRSHRRVPEPELPRLLERSQLLFSLGVVDGSGVALDGSEDEEPGKSTLRQETEATPRPPVTVTRSWAGLEDHREAPRGALLTPEYVLQHAIAMDAAAADPDTVGKHVRVLWIGELAQAPALVLAYVERGFNVTVHTSTEHILEGFVPHVRRAFERAIPRVAGFDFLKLLLLYKLGGLVVDADTVPVLDAADVLLPAGCDVLLGKETHLKPGKFSAPTYRAVGGATYGYNRPFQLLNWAMAATKTRNRHVEEMIVSAMRHFFGLRDMEQDLVQDVAGSGMLSDYVALLHEQHGLDYATSFEDVRVRPMEGLCMLDDELRGGWIEHKHMASWHLKK